MYVHLTATKSAVYRLALYTCQPSRDLARLLLLDRFPSPESSVTKTAVALALCSKTQNTNIVLNYSEYTRLDWLKNIGVVTGRPGSGPLNFLEGASIAGAVVPPLFRHLNIVCYWIQMVSQAYIKTQPADCRLLNVKEARSSYGFSVRPSVRYTHILCL